MHPIEARLQDLGITLPQAAGSVANYVPFQKVGDTVYVSGQLPFSDGELLFPGMVGKDVTMEQAQQAARVCALNLLAQCKAALDGTWKGSVQCVKLGGFVQAIEGYTFQPEVINGASDLMVEVLGDAGRHARFAVGVSSLPRNACVEIDAVFALSTS